MSWSWLLVVGVRACDYFIEILASRVLLVANGCSAVVAP